MVCIGVEAILICCIGAIIDCVIIGVGFAISYVTGGLLIGANEDAGSDSVGSIIVDGSTFVIIGLAELDDNEAFDIRSLFDALKKNICLLSQRSLFKSNLIQ